MLSQKLLDILVCTKCKQPVSYNKKKNELVCGKCRLRYKISKDIPDMLLEDAEKI